MRGGGSTLLLVRPNGMGSLSGKCDPKAKPTVRRAGESLQEIRLTTTMLRVSLESEFSSCAESNF